MGFFGVLTPTEDAYWADSVNGSDSNTGTQTAPFQSLTKLQSADAAANKSRWELVTGSHWTGQQLTVPRAGMTIAAYGSGAKPIIDCGVGITAVIWVKTGGYTNIYEAAGLTVVNAPGGAQWVNVWANGITHQLPRAASLAALDAAIVPTYFVDSDLPPFKVYVNLQANPGSLANGYVEYTGVSQGLSSLHSTTIIGIQTQRNFANNGSLEVDAPSTLVNVQCDYGAKHNCLLAPGCTVYGMSLNYSYYAGGNANMLILFGTWAPGLGEIINNLTITNYGLGGTFDTSNVVGVYAHGAGSGGGPFYFSNPNITGIGTALAFEGETTSAVTVVGGTIGTVGSPVQAAWTPGGYTWTISNLNAYATLNVGGFDSGYNKVTNSTLIAAPGHGVFYVPSVYAPPMTIDVQGSTLAGGVAFDINYANPILVNSHNDLTGITTYAIKISSPFVYTGDYNTYYSGWTNLFAKQSPFTNYTFAQWQTLTGQDTHSTN